MKGERRTLRLDSIRVDERAQPRAAISTDRIGEYVEDMSRGDKFPPLVVFQDKKKVCWLADGFHRYHAHVGVESKTVDCIVHRGELRDAILYSVGANAAHGLRRSNADKRQAVAKLLTDKEWRDWTDSEIARRCHVGHDLVGRLRAELIPVTCGNASEPRNYRNKHGSTGKMKTAKIGKGKRQPTLDLEEPLPPQVVRDTENAWISSALWEIERQIDSLPPPDETAEQFPTRHYHTFTAAKLRSMADWLVGFADAWARVTTESGHGQRQEARTEAAAH
jgi:hypothetical protein